MTMRNKCRVSERHEPHQSSERHRHLQRWMLLDSMSVVAFKVGHFGHHVSRRKTLSVLNQFVIDDVSP